MSFPSLVSKNQIQKLAQVNIHSLYDLITFLPFDLENIVPIDSFFGQSNPQTTTKSKYLLDGILTDLQIKAGSSGQSYLYLSFRSANRFIQCYYFASSQYTAKSLKVGMEYQVVLINSGTFWSIDKLALKTDFNSSNFRLGSAKMQSYLLPKYPKRGIFMSQFFAQIHSQLPQSCYLLDLVGFVPDNNFLSNKISLFGIHHPQDSKNYFTSLQNWTAVGVFKKLTLMRCLDKQKEIKYAKSSQLDLDLLKQISVNLPFELSISQKSAIWELIKSLTN